MRNFMMNKELNYILKSEIRFHIILQLKNGIKTPKELSSQKFYLSHISTNLKELENKNYVICINPNDRKNKKYSLTKKSEDILNYLHKITK